MHIIQIQMRFYKKANERYNIILFYFCLLFLFSHHSWYPIFLYQSFYFNPVSSQFTNYCVFVPVLPYVLQFQESYDPKLNLFTSSSQTKRQQIDQITMKTIESTIELEKLKNSDYKKSNKQNQDSIFLQAKNFNVEPQSEKKRKNKGRGSRNSHDNGKISLQIKCNDESLEKSAKIIKNKKNKQSVQEEYQPFQKRKKCEPSIKENQNRNIIPNQVNQIFSYIQKSTKSKYVVNRIFSKYHPPKPEYNIKRFYLYQSLLKEKVSNYINESSLSLVTQLYEPRCEVYSQQQQRYYNKISRVLIHHFLQQDSVFNILTSRRMHKDKKRSHLQMRRVLKDKVVEILKH